MKKIGVLIILLLIWGHMSHAQTSIIWGETEERLSTGIRDMNVRTAAVAFNIANGTTPGFKPIRFADEIAEAQRIYGDDSVLKEVNVDDEMIKATKLRLRHQAYIKLLTTKLGITKKVATMGKGG